MRWSIPLVALVLTAQLACGYPADATAEAALISDAQVEVRVAPRGLTAFIPTDALTSTALVFYPGGLVDELAYAPLLRRLAEAGVPSVLVAKPANLSVLAPRKGDRALDAFPDLGPWIAAGHSLGGAMAATWADQRRDELAGLVLLAAYPAAGRDLSDAPFPVLSITASEDEVLDADKFEDRRALLPANTTFVDIEGGNHAGFGSYGEQRGDGEAAITAEAQWDAVVDTVVAWLHDHQDAAGDPDTQQAARYATLP